MASPTLGHDFCSRSPVPRAHAALPTRGAAFVDIEQRRLGAVKGPKPSIGQIFIGPHAGYYTATDTNDPHGCSPRLRDAGMPAKPDGRTRVKACARYAQRAAFCLGQSACAPGALTASAFVAPACPYAATPMATFRSPRSGRERSSTQDILVDHPERARTIMRLAICENSPTGATLTCLGSATRTLALVLAGEPH